MFREANTHLKFLLLSIALTVIGIYLPWVGFYESPIRGIHLRYGPTIMLMIILILIVVHISKKWLSYLLVIVFSAFSIFTVLQHLLSLETLIQPENRFNWSIGGLVTLLGTFGMLVSGITGIKDRKESGKES